MFLLRIRFTFTARPTLVFFARTVIVIFLGVVRQPVVVGAVMVAMELIWVVGRLSCSTYGRIISVGRRLSLIRQLGFAGGHCEVTLRVLLELPIPPDSTLDTALCKPRSVGLLLLAMLPPSFIVVAREGGGGDPSGISVRRPILVEALDEEPTVARRPIDAFSLAAAVQLIDIVPAVAFVAWAFSYVHGAVDAWRELVGLPAGGVVDGIQLLLGGEGSFWDRGGLLLRDWLHLEDVPGAF